MKLLARDSSLKWYRRCLRRRDRAYARQNFGRWADITTRALRVGPIMIHSCEGSEDKCAPISAAAHVPHGMGLSNQLALKKLG